MNLLKSDIYDEFKDKKDLSIYKRTSARGIILDNEEILLIYTKRYNDYGFPGGGVDENEDVKDALIRELQEETGATNIQILKDFGSYEELRPTHYEGFDALHMFSHFFICKTDKILGEANPEDYEIQNGSEPVWVNIHKAIKHNKEVIASKHNSMGLSITRETYVLELIAENL